MDYQFDLIVIGAGPGGYVPAIKAAGEGMKTAIVEKDFVGGTCLNRGCIPTKTLLHTADLYREMGNCEAIGIHTENTSLSMETLKARKDEVAAGLRKGIEASLKKAKVTCIAGTAMITGNHEVTVTAYDEETDKEPQQSGSGENAAASAQTATYTAKNILIATGSAPVHIPVPGADLPGVVDSDALLDRSQPPYERLVIIGGGVIGMEFASLYQALGSKVTVIEALDKLLANLDKEFGQSVKMLMKKRGVDIHTSASLKKIEKSGDELICTYTEKDQEQTVVADGVLIAVGRRPVSAGLFGPDVQVEMERGRVLVNENFQTSIPNIYAAGDVIGGIQLAHTASAEGLHAVAHMAGKNASVRLDLVPSCVYIDPELASVGLTADQAKAEGIPAKSVKYPMSANGKSFLSNQERGFIKVVYNEEDHKVLGAQMMCARATDMLSIFTTAIANNLTVEEMQKAMYPHPTFSEGIGEVLELV